MHEHLMSTGLKILQLLTGKYLFSRDQSMHAHLHKKTSVRFIKAQHMTDTKYVIRSCDRWVSMNNTDVIGPARRHQRVAKSHSHSPRVPLTYYLRVASLLHMWEK